MDNSGRGNPFRVADSRYFMDGWGIIPGDRIQLEGQTEPATITKLDYATHSITLDREVTFSNRQGVALAYNGAAPDLGAFEIVSTEP